MNPSEMHTTENTMELSNFQELPFRIPHTYATNTAPNPLPRCMRMD